MGGCSERKNKRGPRPGALFAAAKCFSALSLLVVIGIVGDGLLEPGDVKDVGSADRCAFLCAGSVVAAPVVLDCVDAAGANGRVVEGADVGDSDLATKQVVQMDVDQRGGVDGDVHIFIADVIPGDDHAGDGGAAAAAVDVDTHAAGGSGVPAVGQVAGDGVADDAVVAEVIGRRMKGRANVAVQRDAADSIAGQRVADDDIARDAAGASAIREEAHASASHLHAVIF